MLIVTRPALSHFLRVQAAAAAKATSPAAKATSPFTKVTSPAATAMIAQSDGESSLLDFAQWTKFEFGRLYNDQCLK